MSPKPIARVLILISAILLAACSSTVVQDTAPTLVPTVNIAAPESASTETLAPSLTPVVPVSESTNTPAAAASPTPGQGSPAASTGGQRTFRIVPEQTDASYQVQEKFLNRDLPNMAVGKTNSVEGELRLNMDGRPGAEIPKMVVDLRTLTSDSSRRDQRIRQQWLESDKYPFAEFVSTGVLDGPETYTEGETVDFKLAGNMTIRDVTRPVTFDVQAKLVGDTVTGTAKTQILMKDFGFNPPDVAGMLTVQDGVTVTVNFTAQEVK